MFRCAHPLSAETIDTNDGIAMVTSIRGEVSITDTSGKTKSLDLHKSLTFADTHFLTAKNSHFFMGLSNGLGVGVDANTKVRVKNFTQTPYDKERINVGFEPSTSELIMELEYGALSIVSEGLSPRSQTNVRTPNGVIRVHAAHCRIEHNETGTIITSLKGNVSFDYPEANAREYISNMSAIRISDQSAKIGRITEKIEPKDISIRTQTFTKATEQASKRVLFRFPKGSKQVQAVLITHTDYYKQVPARPYEYIDIMQ
ncbi:MAG: FecR domain-containing protein [Opitutaceae bacterium]